MIRLTLLAIALLIGSPAAAVTAVNPFGVNVRASGPTTVFLTFQGLDPGEVAVEAFWCGELQPAVIATNPTLQFPFAVQTTDPCVPGTVYGRLPLALDRSRPSTSGAIANFTDIMTIPASVARRAYQDAQAGLNSAFFYVRRFTGGVGGDKFVIVTCRMAGGGARVPLALMDVRLAFTAGGAATVLALERGTPPPRFEARIRYNGTGTLKGRWEVVMPGDPEPTDEDLLTEATLPVERRALQRRFTLLERFEQFLPPTGEAVIAGPDPRRVPHRTDGAYKILLRIEASDDKEADSDTGGGRIAHAGGVAGFPMPVLRYYVGSGASVEQLAAASTSLRLFAPEADARVKADAPLEFSWASGERAALLRLEVQAEATTVLAALLAADATRYVAPPFAIEAQRGKVLRWRVVALDAGGRTIAGTPWRTVTVEP
ncbi:MAG: hypothetical protein ACK4V1_02455 [Burkholderiaceae bacterium]